MAAVTDFCREAGIELIDGAATIALSNERKHDVRLEEVDADTLRVWAIVAKRRRVRDIENLDTELWRRNRGTRLVGFYVDAKGRVIGSAWVPRQGLTPDELKIYVTEVAKQSDRLEFVLTGRDDE